MDFKIRGNRKPQGRGALVHEREEYFRLMDQGRPPRSRARMTGMRHGPDLPAGARRVPYEDPGLPDHRSPLRFLWWLIRSQPLGIDTAPAGVRR